jgi:molecular chaperone DnaJ
MPKNYYIVLGISSASNQDEIKAAYRRLAKEYHPDLSGEGHSPFQVIQEAYSVLSDPRSRRAYDESRRQQKRKIMRGLKFEPMAKSPEAPPEPLVPEQGPIDLDEAYLSRSFESFRPSFEALFDRIISNFEERTQAKGERPEPLSVIVALSPEQAFRGVHVRIMVPARLRCPNCGGYGGIGYYECWRCSGAGVIAGEYPVIISSPPGISDGHVVRLSLDRFHIRNLYLNVIFRISELL